MIAGIVAGQAAGAASGDPYFSSVTLLLHMDGPDGSTSFPDSSVSPKTVTPAADAKISTSQSMFGGASASFDGAGDYLTSPSTPDFDFGTGEFTMECFVRLAAYSASFDGSYGGNIAGTYQFGGPGPYGFQWRITGNSSSYDAVYLYNGNSDYSFPYSFSLNTWYHIAVSRVSGQLRTFVNGVQIGSVSYSGDFGGSVADNRPLLIGALGHPTFKFYLNGFIDEFRITKGVGRYSGAFTPPSEPFPDS